MKSKIGIFMVLMMCFSVLGWADQGEGPIKREMDGAEYRLKKFERTVELARGKPFKLRHVEQEALRRIKALHKNYPNNPQVKAMVDRARKALIASKGDNLLITEEMLAYRTQTKKMIKKFSREAESEWNVLFEEIKNSKDPILKAFPRPDPRRISIDDLKDRWFVFEEFSYPENVFKQGGSQYVFAGKPSTGFYFFDLSSPAWGGAYESIRRYRHQVSGDLPQEMKWTVAGKITSVVYLVPEGGKKKARKAEMGWLVEPVAVYVPGYTLGKFDTKSEVGGSFSGEDRIEEIKKGLFTVNSVPEDASVTEVAKAYVTAIKEKNSKLWFELIDPARLKTPTAVSRAWYHWELHQHRWHEYYVHAEFGEPKIEVIKGFDDDNDLEGWLLSDKDKSEIKKHEDPLVERATIWVKFYDERGRQVGLPSPFYLKRYEKKRWFSTSPTMPN